ncbi:sugar phosphate nucleotidyltransferase [Geojedonia litorea]|uniref:Sugar phosphate nucleotidyltransferase n=1 Tax=Geojedonia litorea TaxID=1268269 RepID=A0ABV9N0V0_9FLAO
MEANLIILAGGASTRMNASLNSSASNWKNKALIGIDSDGRPILDYLITNAEKAGYKNLIIVTGENAIEFKSFYGKQQNDNLFGTLKISYATQYVPKDRVKPLGTADALLQALQQYSYLKKTTFIVCNADNLYSVEAFEALIQTPFKNAFIAYDRKGLNFSTDRISKFALVQLDQDQFLSNIIEKPEPNEISKCRDTSGSLRVSMNIFKLDGSAIISYLENCPMNPERNEKELPSAILNMCHEIPKAMKGILFHEHVPDLTSKEDIAVLKHYLDTAQNKKNS